MELGNLMFGNSRGRFEVPRSESDEDFVWQRTFIEFMDEIGIDGYGLLDNENLKQFETNRGGFENNVFVINPYYWGGDEEIMKEPNFIFKPTGLTIDWYKYPLRDSYSNQELTFDKFKDVLEKCKSSVSL